MQVKFKKEKETKNTMKYEEIPEQGNPPVMGTMYLQKWFAADRAEITIDIPEAK
jgi:hypothetical protein